MSFRIRLLIFFEGIEAIFHAFIFPLHHPISSLPLLPLYDGGLTYNVSLFSRSVDIALHHQHWHHTRCGAQIPYDIIRLLGL